MKRSTTLLAPAAAALALAALAAGCGGSPESASGGPSSAGTAGKSAAGRATIAVGRSLLGRVLVDGRGRTVYLFKKDTRRTSRCYGPCASVWPPVTTSGAANARNGAGHAKLGLTRRRDGKLQVTYAHHPLYTYAGDTKPGQTNGEGVDEFGAEWYVLSPAGIKLETIGH
jgi:predicted lipoprotein with Yx(FWY)xxD motif